MKYKFQQVVAVITLVLILISVIVTFVGAFTSGNLGRGLLFTGMAGFVFFAILGWAMIRIYDRVHKEKEDADEKAEGK